MDFCKSNINKTTSLQYRDTDTVIILNIKQEKDADIDFIFSLVKKYD